MADILQNEFIPWAPWNVAPPEAKIALVTTGGVYLKKGLHQPYGTVGDASFREFPSLVAGEDLDLAPGFTDLSYAREDVNVLFPLERLQALALAGYIGSVAPFVYSFMGGEPDLTALLSNYAPSVAYRLKRMGADFVLVVAGGEKDHQTAGVLARTIELAGVPTCVLGTDEAVLRAVGVPRSVVVEHPAGAPLGNPGNSGKHQQLLRDLLEAAWSHEGPGLVSRLDYRWNG